MQKYRIFKYLFIVLIAILLFVVFRSIRNTKTLIQKQITKDNKTAQEEPTVSPTLTRYTLNDAYRGTPRLVSMQKGENILTSNKYYDILKQRIENDNLSAKVWFESKCNEFWIFDKPDDEFASVERHQYHQDGCPGDPNFTPRMDTFNIDKTTNEIFWLDVGKNKNIPYGEWAKVISKE